MKQQININKVIPNKDNPRIIKDHKFKELVASIKGFPKMFEKRPIVVDENMIVLGGNMRLRAAQSAGLKEIWIDDTEDWSEEEKREFVIKDNVPYGEWEWDTLANEWDTSLLKDYGLDVWQNIDDIKVEVIGLIDDDKIPAAKNSRVKNGDVWILGNHKLMCGDSTSISDVRILMNGSKASMVFTDPPYDILDQNYSESINDSVENAHIFVMHDDKGIVEYLRKSALEFLKFFIADFTFSSPRGNDAYLNHIIISQEKKGNAIMYQNMFDGFGSIIKMKYRGTITNEDIFHKHQKPIDFVEKFINHFSIKDSIVLDLFLGSGSTLISCEKSKRKCYGMELNENSCDIIIERWEQFTGDKAIKQ